MSSSSNIRAVLAAIILATLAGCSTIDHPINTAPAQASKVLAVAVVDTCIDYQDASALQLAMELVSRGFERWGCYDDGAVTATWSPPTTGSPARRYVFEARLYGTWPDTTLIIPIPAWCDSVDGRAAGIDSLDRQGEFSAWSEPIPITHE